MMNCLKRCCSGMNNHLSLLRSGDRRVHARENGSVVRAKVAFGGRKYEHTTHRGRQMMKKIVDSWHVVQLIQHLQAIISVTISKQLNLHFMFKLLSGPKTFEYNFATLLLVLISNRLQRCYTHSIRLDPL